MTNAIAKVFDNLINDVANNCKSKEDGLHALKSIVGRVLETEFCPNWPYGFTSCIKVGSRNIIRKYD